MFVLLLCSVGLLLCLSYGWWMVVYWWSVSDDLMVSWWSVGAVLAQTVQWFSLYCASASSWRFGMFEWYFWWCMGGIFLAGVLAVVALLVVSPHNMGQFFNCVSN